MSANGGSDCIVELRGVSARYGAKHVLDDVDLCVHRGELLAVVGGSGSGKSTLLRHMLMLSEPSAGRARVFGKNVERLSEAERKPLRQRMGTLFQHGALFGALTVLENVAVPLKEYTDLDPGQIAGVAALEVALAPKPEDGHLHPSELSGGMRKRAGLARALALDPELLFLDEPQSGLDPHSADALDELILKLKTSLGLTIVMVTHDMDSCWRTADRIALLGEGRLLAVDRMEALAESDEASVRAFFEGPRAQGARMAQTARAG